MKKNKKLFLVISTSAVAMGLVAATLAFRYDFNKITRAEPTDFDVTLELTSSNLTSGSGTVTLNGNLFTYEGITVSGSVITLSENSRIYANKNSGSSTGENDNKGAGFNDVTFIGGAGGTASAELNGVEFNITVTSSDSYTKSVSSRAFDLLITSGSLELSKITLTYSCTYDTGVQKVLFVGSGNMSAGEWKDFYDEMATTVDGIEVECDHFTTGSFTFLQIGNIVTNYSNVARQFRDKLASEDWDAVYFQLSRRITPSGIDLYNAEYDMFKDVIVPLTKTVTDNITLLAMEGEANPTIFDYDEENGQPISTGTSETKTADEMTTFLDETAVDWATDAGVKVARYGLVYNYCGTVGSNSTTRSNARKYARGLMAYATINDKQIPSNIGTLWVSTCFSSNSDSAKTIKNNIGAKVNELTFA